MQESANIEFNCVSGDDCSGVCPSSHRQGPYPNPSTLCHDRPECCLQLRGGHITASSIYYTNVGVST